MSTVFTEIIANEHIKSLESKIEAFQPQKVDCLVIAHSDAAMIQRVVDALDSDAVAVLPLNQIDWFENLAEVVTWAAEQHINHVVVVGHSKTVAPIPQPQIYYDGRPTELEESRGFESVIAGTRSLEDRLQMSKNQFGASMRQLAESHELQDTYCDDSFHLTPLFYVAHEDFFLLFDFQNEAFVPLTSCGS